MSTSTREKRKTSFFLDGQVCTQIGLLGNILLTAFKLASGLLGHSKAMVADALHSASDVLATGIVFVGLRISNKPADDAHPYGHGNADTIASFMVALILLLTGLYLGYSVAPAFVHFIRQDEVLTPPGNIALYAAIVSIIIKESMYHYTIGVGKRLNSQAIIANAWDHRSDAISSIPALIGIFIAQRWEFLRIFDPIASLIIAIMIFRISLHLLHSSVDIIMDESPSKETIQEISKIATGVEGVALVHDLRVHQRGPDRTVDIKIEVDGQTTVSNGHAIAGRVKASLIKSDLRIVDAMVHVNPVEDSISNIENSQLKS